MPTKAAARRPRKTTAPKHFTAQNVTAPKRPQTEIVAVYETFHGFSFIVLAKGRGQHRVHWWYCSGCWQNSADNPSWAQDQMREDALAHIPLCPGAPYRAQIRVVWADGHPPTDVRA